VGVGLSDLRIGEGRKGIGNGVVARGIGGKKREERGKQSRVGEGKRERGERKEGKERKERKRGKILTLVRSDCL
jgi:hypothetical protein